MALSRYTIGARVKIDGEKEYREQLRAITQETKTMHAETQRMESSWGKTATAQQRATQQASLLRDQIARQKDAVEAARAAVATYSEKCGESDRRTLQWKEKLAQAEAELNRLNQKLREVPSTMQIYGQRMQEMGSKITAAGRSISSAGQTLTRTVSLPVAAIGTASVKMATDFETSMAKVSTIADDTEVSYDDMKQAILDLSNTTGVAATDVAENVYQAISAGQDTADAVNFVSKATKLAKSGFAETGDALDVLTTILNAYGLQSEETAEVSDKLITTQNLGKTTVAQLAESMGKVIPTAAAYNVSLDQLTSGYVTLTKNGISTAEATTYLNSMIDEMGKTGSKSATVLKNETGKSLKDLMDEGYSLTDVLEIIGVGADAAGVSISDMFTNKNARKAANSLTQNVDDFRGALDAMAESAGATDAAFNKVTDTTAAKFAKTMNQLKNTGIDLGEAILTTLAPTIQDLAGDIKKASEWFRNLDDDQKELIVKFGLVAAAAGPVLTATGKLVTGVGQITSGAGKLMQHLPGVASVLGPVGLAFGVAAAAGVGLGLALKALSDKYGDTGDDVQQFNEKMIETVSAAAESRKAVEDATGSLAKAVENAEQTMADADTAAALTDRYVAELEELASKSSLTTEEQYRLKAVVDKLNTLYPGFTQAVMDSNGQLKIGVGDLKEYCKQLKETAREQALQEAYKEIVDKIVEAEKKKYDAEYELQKLTAASTEAMQQQKQVMEEQEAEFKRLEDATTTYQDLLATGTASIEELNDAHNKMVEAQNAVNDGFVNLNGQMVDANGAVQTFADAQTQAATETDKLQASIDAAGTEIEEDNAVVEYYQGEMDALKASVEGTTAAEEEMEGQTEETGEVVEEVTTIIDAYGNTVDETTGQITEYANEATKAFMTALDSARQSIEGQIGLFDQMKIEAQHTVEDMQSALDSQAAAYDQMAADMEVAWDYAVECGDGATRNLVSQIANLGISGAGDMHTLAEAIRGENYDIVNTMSKTSEDVGVAKERYAEILAQAQSQTVATGDGIVSATEVAGTDAVSSWEQSMRDMQNSTTQGMGEVKTAVEDGMSSAEQSVSDRQGTMAASAQTAFGGVEDAARNTATNMSGYGQEAMQEYESGIQTGGYGAVSAAQSVASQAASGLDSSSSYAYSSGYGLGSNFASGVYAAASYVSSAVSYVSSIAASYLHHSTPDKGPLKDDDKWGAEMVENYANAMIRAIPKAQRAAAMVAEAVAIAPNQSVTIEPGVVSGEYVREDKLLLDYDMIYQAVRAGASDADNSVIINNREFGRILRDAGVAMA